MKQNWQPLLDFVDANQCNWSLQPDSSGEQWGIHQLDDPPHNRLYGPVFARGPTCGLIIENGQESVRWGDISRADMTFSVTKTYLALTAGIAFDQGLISDLDEAIGSRLPERGFDSEQNRDISWRQMLQFTSEWEGSCFGIPEQVDRYRVLSLQPDNGEQGRKGDPRQLRKPGTYWEYNDVRINQFAYALMHLFARPLPEVFAEQVMQKIGASDSWRWHGYDNSWETINGRSIQSVPGGGHWGGGMVISVQDQARVAQLLIDYGRYKGRQIVSQEWIELMTTPCAIAPFYGFFTWLNTKRLICRTVSESSYFAMGIGGQYIWHEPDAKRLAVIRWTDAEKFEELMRIIVESID